MNGDTRGAPDFSVPSPARMYDYFLGGKDNFAADRDAADRVIAAYPETRRLARANRRFVTRVAWYLAEHGIRQYVDLGSGLPTSPNVHEIVRKIRRDARVVYVDDDPMVAAHGRAECAGEGIAFIERDIRYPQEILTDRRLTNLIDFTAPVAFLCAAVLHFIPDEDNPKDIVAALRWRMAPGSYLVTLTSRLMTPTRRRCRPSRMCTGRQPRPPCPGRRKTSKRSSPGSTSWSQGLSTCRSGGQTRAQTQPRSASSPE